MAQSGGGQHSPSVFETLSLKSSTSPRFALHSAVGIRFATVIATIIAILIDFAIFIIIREFFALDYPPPPVLKHNQFIAPGNSKCDVVARAGA